MFSNTPIRTLLTWGFGIIIALIVCMALIVTQKSSAVAGDVERIGTEDYPKVVAAAAIRFNAMKNWSNALLMFQTTDSAEIAQLNAETDASRKVVEEQIAYLERTITSETGKQNLASLKKTREAYRDNGVKYRQFVKDGNRDEANRFLTSTLKKDIDAYTAAIGDVIAYQTKLMDQDTEVTREHMHSLQIMTAIISLLIVVISLATAIVVVQVIGKALGGEVQYASDIARKIAGGDLGVDVRAAPGDSDSLLASMKTMVEHLRGMVRQIDGGASQLGGAARQMAQASHAVANASAKQSEATTATAAAVEQMTVSIGQIADSAEQAVSVSQHSQELSRKGSQVIHGAAAEMSKIADSVEASSAIIATLEQQSNEISAVVNVIKDIADQTNLLALNAAIEAARAGEQGRGFAVVADEVRKLAERTSLSTQEIASTIQKIQDGTQSAVHSMVAGVEQVRSGTALAQEAGTSIREIESGAQRAVAVVNDISSSLREQSSVSDEIAKNVENIARMVEANNASAEGVAGNAQQLERLADELAVAVRSFRL